MCLSSDKFHKVLIGFNIYDSAYNIHNSSVFILIDLSMAISWCSYVQPFWRSRALDWRSAQSAHIRSHTHTHSIRVLYIHAIGLMRHIFGSVMKTFSASRTNNKLSLVILIARLLFHELAHYHYRTGRIRIPRLPTSCHLRLCV